MSSVLNSGFTTRSICRRAALELSAAWNIKANAFAAEVVQRPRRMSTIPRVPEAKKWLTGMAGMQVKAVPVY